MTDRRWFRFVVVSILVLPFLMEPVWAEDKTRSDPWTTSYALESQGLYDKAAATLVPLLEDPAAAEFAWLRYGWLSYLLGNYNDSIDAYRTSLSRNSASLDARLGMTLPLMAQRRWREALRVTKQVLAVTELDYTANLNLLACYEGLKQWSLMKKQAQNVAARFPSQSMPWVYLARALANLGDKANAARAYSQVVMRSPNNLEAQRYLKGRG